MASHGKWNAPAGPRRPVTFIPRLEELEDKLPPGSLLSLADFAQISSGISLTSTTTATTTAKAGADAGSSLLDTSGQLNLLPPPPPAAPAPTSQTTGAQTQVGGPAPTTAPLNDLTQIVIGSGTTPDGGGGGTRPDTTVFDTIGIGTTGAGTGTSGTGMGTTGTGTGTTGTGTTGTGTTGTGTGTSGTGTGTTGTGIGAGGGGTKVVGAVPVSVGPTVNATPRLRGAQSEVEIAVDPTNPNRVFAMCNNLQSGGPGAGAVTLTMSSFDGGATWTNHQFLATGGDPMCAYDQFGNLFAGFMSPDLTEVDLLVSGDNGLHFRQIGRLRGIELNPAGATIDYCHVATGPGGFIAPGSVWMASSASPPPATPPNRVIFAKGAPVFGYVGLNFENIGAIGPFTGAQVAPPLGPTSNFTGIAVGPEGQVAVGYQNLDPSGNDIVVNTDTDGLGPNGFSPPVFVTHTAMLSFTPIPPLLQRSPDATTRVAYDNSPGPHHGRLYLSYADRPALGSSDTDVFLRWSDTDGANWSQAVRVNDDPGNNSQFFPNLAVDQSSGNVFLDWYDAREDLGVGGVGDLDRQRNTDVRVYGAVTLNGGLSFQTNFRISAGTTSANSIPDPNKLGDYIGITAYGGTFYAAWADNSGNLANNQDRPNPDIATARGYLLRVPGVTNLTGDRFELNNTSSTASQLGTLFTGQTVLDALSIYPADKDYFTFSTSFSGPLTITMDITSGRANEGDLDMRLYAVNGTSLVQIGASTRTGSAVQEQITTNVRAGQPLLLYVFGKTSATNAGTGLYRLTFDAP